MEPVFFKWNDSKEKLKDVSGYFIPGGFSYEDRGRAGMVSGRDPLLNFIAEEASSGKVVIGICNGAQVLVESGLIPLGSGLQMSLAKNVVEGEAVGFLNKWVWITPTCKRDRCATSDWEGTIKLPVAHGEGRFITKDKGVIEELKQNDQIAFCYCDEEGNVSDEAPICPNGSLFGAAGLCNPEGNVVALMPHPERSAEGVKYFESMKRWVSNAAAMKQSIDNAAAIPQSQTIDNATAIPQSQTPIDQNDHNQYLIQDRNPKETEIFIDTIIVNNEERTVEQAARRIAKDLTLKQLKYFAFDEVEPAEVLLHLSLFNPNKEIAYIRKGDEVKKWNADEKREEALHNSPLENGIMLLRRDEPDTGSSRLGKGGESGICYVLGNISEQEISSREFLEVFSNPHSSILMRL